MSNIINLPGTTQQVNLDQLVSAAYSPYAGAGDATITLNMTVGSAITIDCGQSNTQMYAILTAIQTASKNLAIAPMGAPVVISSLAPVTGTHGTSIVVFVYGAGFNAFGEIFMGGIQVPAQTFVSPVLIIINTPPVASAGAVPVIYLDKLNRTASSTFTYT